MQFNLVQRTQTLEDQMTSHGDISHRVMEAVLRSPGRDLEEVVMECGDLTWNQVFLELDRLSRAGEIVLKQKAPGLYSVGLGVEAAATVAITH